VYAIALLNCRFASESESESICCPSLPFHRQYIRRRTPML